MNINTNYSLSGMMSAQARVDSAARNIAQTALPNAQPSKSSSVQPSTEPAQQSSETELANNLVYQLQAKNDFIANVQVLKSKDEMMGTLLDIRA